MEKGFMNYNLKILDKFKEVFNIILIFLTSFIFNIYYGSIGVFPIDTFAFLTRQILLIKVFYQLEITGHQMVFLWIFYNHFF